MKNKNFSAFLVACGAAICLATFSGPALSDNSGVPASARMPNVPAVPPNATSLPARPAIMLNMSRDHQLFYKAYNEFSDYQGSGKPDGGYIHNVAKPYYGYFDPGKCYVYGSGSKLFSPSKLADVNYLCGGNTWSGNFLNWATMTRMDVVRKVLYGGYRSIDEENSTILERASLPMDAHSFAKYYKSRGGSKSPELNKITPHTGDEISICNTTVDDNNAWSHSTKKPPLMRVVTGNYSLWAAHERRQCRWIEETSWDQDGSGNGNDQSKTLYPAKSDYPSRPTGENFGDLVVRVEVCNSALLGGERCRQYPNGKWKPIGLLHEFGEKDQAEFGLMTGSFSNNIGGGILRKNISSFKDEVDLDTGGFNPKVNGIVGTLNKLRIFGYRYADSLYVDDPSEPYISGQLPKSFCAFQTIGLTNGKCMSWGNPIGEMFIESLRYFRGGLIPSAEYGNNLDNIGAKDFTLPHGVAWEDPVASSKSDVFGKPHCRSMNIVNFNASVISYDRDNLRPFDDLRAGKWKSLADYVNEVGIGEGVDKNYWFVGSTPTTSNSLCTSKFIEKLSDVEGLCPYAPGYRGSFSLAGAAYWAHTHSLRDAVTKGAQEFKDPNFRVNTFSVALSPGFPRIVAKGPGDSKVIIQPSYRLHDPDLKGERDGPRLNGSGTLVDFRVIEQSDSHGKYLVIWEDSEQGGDFDQDVAGILEWRVKDSEISVITDVYAESTFRPQGFGYTISGTNKDGAHFHSGIHDFKFDDPTGALACTDCKVGDPATKAIYTITKTTGGVLQDPMYWAAKWGGFTVSSATDKPDAQGKNWDIRNADGNLGADDIPDNYFGVFNPGDLEDAIRSAFRGIDVKSNAAIAVSSSQLTTGSSKYVAEFTSEDPIGGNVKAFLLDADGNFESKPDWSLGEKLSERGPDKREIITNFRQGGLDFRWTGVGADYQKTLKEAWKKKMKGEPLAAVEDRAMARAEALVMYMRGDRSNEVGRYGYDWRLRPNTNILGPVVNAAPWIQLPPSASYFNATTFAGYSSFAQSESKREKLLWVASNDGMVHAVKADNGNPVISFVPGVLAPRLVEQIESKGEVVPFVDGSPFTGDVRLGPDTTPGDWKTYLFGSLGRGGRAFYALDVTTPEKLTAKNAASIFKWQFTDEDDPDLGYVLSDYPIERSSGQASPIVKLNNGKFAIITGNGYQSKNGKAALMILPVDGPDKEDGKWENKKGKRYYKIVADSVGANGLSTPTWVDVDNNGTADVVYAGDLKGRLWKFDISAKNPSEWKVSFSSKPLYDQAGGGEILPITTAPQVTLASAAGGAIPGYTVMFGTGSSYGDGLFPTKNTNRMYSIWDRGDFDKVNGRPLPRGTAKLNQRVYQRRADGKVIGDYIKDGGKSDPDGWYVDLPGTSEMIVSNPIRLAQYVAMVSIRPNADQTSCGGLPEATLYIVNPVTGRPPMMSDSDYLFGNHDGNPVFGISIADQKVSFAFDKTSAKVSPGLVVPSGRSAKFRAIGNGVDPSATDTRGYLRDPALRLQWREIPGLRTR
jgi:type IV pilus assembly protein PilY1